MSLTPNVPEKIIPIVLDEYLIPDETDEEIGRIMCRRGSWMAGIGDMSLSAMTDCRVLPACFGGQSFVQQSITGSGTIFIHAGGTVMKKHMAPKEKIVIDDQTLLAWSGTVTYATRSAQSSLLGICCDCSGEGLFNFVLHGGTQGGYIWTESMPFGKLKKAIAGPRGIL